MKIKQLSIFLLLTLSFILSANAQNSKPQMTQAAAVAKQSAVATFKLNSKLMAREMPYNVILPTDYDADKNAKFPVIYLLHGLTGHFDNWATNTKVSDFAAKYRFIIVMPEGNDGWYTDSATAPNDKYESYITQELIPEIDKKYRTLAERKSRAIAGLSMGGYGGMKFALKFPEMFVLAGSFSGALGAAGFNMDTNGGKNPIAVTINNVFGEADSATRKSNDIFKMVKEMPTEKIANLPFLYLDCGTEDFLIQNNRDFIALLNEKKIKHEFRELPGIHNWVFWNSQVQEFLRLSEKMLTK